MTRLPALTGKEIMSALSSLGFSANRQRGSHVIMKHPDGRMTVVPVHAGETIGPGLLLKILRDADLTKEELKRLLP
jgi:predicted RNA binding protein YcfA (HicA-like mRNA interferase family)